MTSVDFGMLGLDFPDKNSSSLESDLCIEEFENLLQDHNINSQNILDISLQQSGISHNNQMNMEVSSLFIQTKIINKFILILQAHSPIIVQKLLTEWSDTA